MGKIDGHVTYPAVLGRCGDLTGGCDGGRGVLEGGQSTEEWLQHGDWEVGEDDGGVLGRAQQAAAHQQLGLACLQAQLLQLYALYAVAAPIRQHLTGHPYSLTSPLQTHRLHFKGSILHTIRSDVRTHL